MYDWCDLNGLDGQGDFTNETCCGDWWWDGGGATAGGFMLNSGQYGYSYTCWAKDPEGGAIGDPHVTSIYGCESDAPVIIDGDEKEIELMKCENESLSVVYRKSWKNHITRVNIQRGKQREKFEWRILTHPQSKEVCGNTVEFHRYISGINLRVKEVGNHNITGMLADKSCR